MITISDYLAGVAVHCDLTDRECANLVSREVIFYDGPECGFYHIAAGHSWEEVEDALAGNETLKDRCTEC